ncbi:hypothetical protein DACRYDRAFT_117409 [Dacryopinax primogenitus]|uniref:Uncharacterized protein n=1 Tax=Dacryopinax primogenitus (strain DJM 731) TaxID=1858805 RepID=M5FVS3_DACPD|nr:uncharacterized protein DACRYDRAFT_117409 [Dacryopinax primogenitus]EJU00454.1 hypothetical protein DACRYDRAFT_117409 [Dacryopinax primogenitus]
MHTAYSHFIPCTKLVHQTLEAQKAETPPSAHSSPTPATPEAQEGERDRLHQEKQAADSAAAKARALHKHARELHRATVQIHGYGPAAAETKKNQEEKQFQLYGAFDSEYSGAVGAQRAAADRLDASLSQDREVKAPPLPPKRRNSTPGVTKTSPPPKKRRNSDPGQRKDGNTHPLQLFTPVTTPRGSRPATPAPQSHSNAGARHQESNPDILSPQELAPTVHPERVSSPQSQNGKTPSPSLTPSPPTAPQPKKWNSMVAGAVKQLVPKVPAPKRNNTAK